MTTEPGEENQFLHWTDPECVSHARAGLLYRDSWPTYIGFHSFLCGFICLQFDNFFIAFSFGACFYFCFLGLEDSGVVLGLCLFLRENLKLGGEGGGEDLEGLRGGKEYIKIYLH